MEKPKNEAYPFLKRIFDSLKDFLASPPESENVSNEEIVDTEQEIASNQVAAEADDLPSPDLPVYAAEIKEMDDKIKALHDLVAQIQSAPAASPVQQAAQHLPDNPALVRAEQVLQSLKMIAESHQQPS